MRMPAQTVCLFMGCSFRCVRGGILHLADGSIGFRADVVVVICRRFCFQNPDGFPVSIVFDGVDGFYADTGIPVVRQGCQEGLANPRVPGQFLEGVDRFEADARVAVVEENVDEDVADSFAGCLVLQEFYRFQADARFQVSPQGGCEQGLDGFTADVVFDGYAREGVDEEFDVSVGEVEAGDAEVEDFEFVRIERGQDGRRSGRAGEGAPQKGAQQAERAVLCEFRPASLRLNLRALLTAIR